MISVSVIKNEEDFLKLKNVWNNLLDNSISNNIFLTWEWVYTWWGHFGKNKKLFIIIAKENNELVGIAPFYITKKNFFGIRFLFYLEFLGSEQTCPEYLDFIVKKGMEKEVLHLIFEKILFKKDFRWDVLNLVAILNSSKNLAMCVEYFKINNIKNDIYERRNLPFIEFALSFDEYIKTLSKDKQNRFLRYRRNLSKDYSVSFEVINNQEEIDNAYTTFLNIYRKRWEVKGEEGSFSLGRNDYIDFHRNIIKAFLNNKWLYFTVLKVDKEIVAIQYDFIYGNKLYYHSATFDPQWSKYRVGSVMMVLVIEECINKKFSELDFLRGEEEYKFYWTKKTRETVDMAIWRSNNVYCSVKVEKIFRKLFKKFIPKALALKIYKVFFAKK